MYSGYRVNGRISDRAEILTPNFVLVLGLFLFYFSLFIGSMGGELAKREGVLLHSFQSEVESFYCFFHRFTQIYALITNF